MLIHAVYFWLRADLAAAQRSDFISEVKKLSAVRTIEKLYVGTPAPIAAREVTDRSFDVALTIIFRDGSAHDAYQVDPLHLIFVEKNKTSWSRVSIYDSETI